MKKTLVAGVALAAMTASMANADAHLPFAPGDGDFSWDSFNDYAAPGSAL